MVHNRMADHLPLVSVWPGRRATLIDLGEGRSGRVASPARWVALARLPEASDELRNPRPTW